MQALVPRSVRIRRLVRQLRLGRGMSQSTLAKKLHVTPNYIWLLEHGYKFPSLKLALRLGKNFDFNPNWIKTLWFRDYLLWTETKVGCKIGLAA